MQCGILELKKDIDGKFCEIQIKSVVQFISMLIS